MELLIGSAFAIIISIYLIFVKEKYKSKNYKDLWLSIVIGLLVYLSAFVIELFLKLIFKPNDFFNAFANIAITEEGLKFLLVHLFIIKSKKQSSAYDIIKILLLTSLSFALFENIVYVNFFYESMGMDVAFLRLYTAIPMHAICGISMGYFIFNHKQTKNKLYLILAILIPLIMHGGYDYFIFIDKFIFSLLILIFSTIIHMRALKSYFI